MPEVRISIAEREFTVACQEGEEHYLQAAAKLLDNEARVLSEQIGRLPEARMLLMAGLMLADKTAGMEEELGTLKEKVPALEAKLEEIQARPAPEPEKVEVPVIPDSLSDSLAELAARAEALAGDVEEKLAG